MPKPDGTARIVLTNSRGITKRLQQGVEIGSVVPVKGDVETKLLQDEVGQEDIVTPSLDTPEQTPVIPPEGHPGVMEVTSEKVWRKQRLLEILNGELEGRDLTESEKGRLHTLLEDNHDTFSLEDGERGETTLIQMVINTGDADPKKQPTRLFPFGIRREVARQLRHMQETEVIQPSKSASPIVMVRKKDGTLHFCVDYRQLNAVTKHNTFPLLRVDGLLDQLGQSEYFITLHLANGYWQLRILPDSQDKTAFTTHQGLYELRVMSFGLCNAPAVF